MQSTIKKYVKIRKLILHQVFIEWSYRGHAHYQRRVMKKKMGLLFWGSGTLTFWLGVLLFIKRESQTPTFKIQVRTLSGHTSGSGMVIFTLCVIENKTNAQKSKRESNICPQSTNYVFTFDIPVTAFSHATTACAQYKWHTVVKDREILTRLQQPQVSIWIYLKGRFCYQRGIESTRQHMWKECVSHKNTLYAHEANDNSNKWVSVYVLLTARSYGDVDLGLKSNMKGLRSLGSNSWLLGDDEKLHITPPRHNFLIFHTVKYLIKKTFHHAPPLHFKQVPWLC